jgi:hypothetical protein
MQKNFTPDRMARLFSAVAAVAVLGLGVGGCDFFSGDGQETASSVAIIEPIEGMKYYVGGPMMEQDQHGRMRVSGFNGEVRKPTARGLVIGFKELDGGRFELRTWLNGSPVTEQFGFIDEAGLFWYDERSTLNSDGVVIVRQTLTYDDEAEIMHSKVEHLDPADGEIVKSYETDLPYADPDEDEEEDDEAAEEQ